MAHNTTVFSQRLTLISRHQFESLTNQYHIGRSFRTASRYSQFVTMMMMAQLLGRSSLRDIVENMSAQYYRLYHLGSAKLSRSNLSRINNNNPYELYEALFGTLLVRGQSMVLDMYYVFHTNNFKLAAKTIADISRARWQVELFFKLIKIKLKMQSFVGKNNNDVLTQIWVVMCIYLLTSSEDDASSHSAAFNVVRIILVIIYRHC